MNFKKYSIQIVKTKLEKYRNKNNNLKTIYFLKKKKLVPQEIN